VEEPVLTLDSTRLRAEPGGQVQLSVKVRNPGHLVESFRLDVLGLDPSWTQVHPPELPVYPGKEESAIVVISPPAHSQAPDEALPFAVRAVSTLDPERSVVEEGDLEVGRILDLQGAITPVTSRARWSGRHRVTYTNWGNSVVHLRLSILDKDELLGFRLAPEQVTVPVGGSASARLRVRARKPFLRGVPVHRPFQVVGESGTGPVLGTPRSAAARAGVPDPGRPVLDGALQQQPILSRAVVTLVGLLVAAVVALFAIGLKTSKVPGATVEDVAPAAPAKLTAESVSGTQIQLTWAASDRAQGYQVKSFSPAGAEQDTLPVAGLATTLTVQKLKPLTEYCYRVLAFRGANGSQSAQQCAKTSSGELPPPTDVQAVLQGGADFVVSWKDSEQNDHVILLDGSPLGDPKPKGESSATVTIPAGSHRIQVIGRRPPDQSSQPSKAVTVQSSGAGTATATPPTDGSAGSPTPTSSAQSTSGGGTGAVTVSGWMAAFGPFQETPLAQSALTRLQAAGFSKARIVPVNQTGLGVNGIVVVVDGLPDAAAAQRICDAQKDTADCQPAHAPG
jgi:Fibronectin type III domain